MGRHGIMLAGVICSGYCSSLCQIVVVGSARLRNSDELVFVSCRQFFFCLRPILLLARYCAVV